jgi:hypothetical protein
MILILLLFNTPLKLLPLLSTITRLPLLPSLLLSQQLHQLPFDQDVFGMGFILKIPTSSSFAPA